MTGDEPLVKGFIAIQSATLMIEPLDEHKSLFTGEARNAVPLDASKTFQFVEDAAVYHGDDRNAGKAKKAGEIGNWLETQVDQSLDVFFPTSSAPLGKSFPAYLRRMHCPYYNTTAGMLWGSAYALRVPRAKTPAEFFLTALRASLVRNDAKAEHLLAAVRAQQKQPARLIASTRAVMRQYADMFCTYPVSMVYLDDFTNEGGRTLLARPEDSPIRSPDGAKKSHVGRVRLMHRNELLKETGNADGTPSRKPRAKEVDISEDYKDARLGHGDDCEGVSKEAYTQFWDFRRADLSTLSNTPDVELLRHFQMLSQANVYTPVMVLAGVTNKKLDANVRRDMTDEEAMAHTYTALIPTTHVLERLEDASSTDKRFSGLSADVRKAKYAVEYKRQAWHDELGVLICEGTARSSSLVLPIATYYHTMPEKQRAVKSAAARFNVQVQLMQDLPLDVIQLEIPNRRLDDEDGKIANDLIDASDFYKGNSAVYCSAFRDSGILDLAFAWKDEDTGTLTHGLRFNRFVSQGKWHKSVRLVPYNKLNETQGAYTDSVLAQLEPIPALRLTKDVKVAPVPRHLAILSQLYENNAAAAQFSTASLLKDPHAMPPPPNNIVLSIRDEDLTAQVAEQVYNAIAANKHLFTGAAVHTHYLSDAPVAGDEETLPPVIIHDIELRLQGQPE